MIMSLLVGSFYPTFIAPPHGSGPLSHSLHMSICEPENEDEEEEEEVVVVVVVVVDELENFFFRVFDFHLDNDLTQFLERGKMESFQRQ